MARKDALLKLHARLVARKRELIGKIEEQLVMLRTEQDHTAGDELDAAAISMNSELTSQLAEHESRELMSIERALHRMREGTYGICEVSGKKIPIERLNILPYTTVSVDAQRELENNPELREELEQRHERELASLHEEDEEEEFRSEEESEPAADEPEEESRSARRRAALESAAKASTKSGTGSKGGKSIPASAKAPAPPSKGPAKGVAKPSLPAKTAPAKVVPTKSVAVKSSAASVKSSSGKAVGKTKPAAVTAKPLPSKSHKPAAKAAVKSSAKPTAKSAKPASKVTSKTVSISKASVSRRTSASKPTVKSAAKAKAKGKAGSRHR
jgi:DnaK suppressor protein